MQLGLTYKQRKEATPYVLLLPVLAAIVAVIGFPIVRALIMSFQSYSLMRPGDIRFIGFENYARALRDPVFWSTLTRTAIYVLSVVAIQFVLGFSLALLINRPSVISGISKALMLIPWIIPGVLGAFMWRWLFNANYGLINHVLLELGLISERIAWLSRSDTAMLSVVVASAWRGMPFFALMLYAALQAVPHELYEAARIDGAREWQQVVFVTVPYIMPVIVATTLLRVIWQANFLDFLMIMTDGGPGLSTMVLALHTYRVARSTLDYGYASALAILLTLALVLVAFLYVRIRKEDIV